MSQVSGSPNITSLENDVEAMSVTRVESDLDESNTRHWYAVNVKPHQEQLADLNGGLEQPARIAAQIENQPFHAGGLQLGERFLDFLWRRFLEAPAWRSELSIIRRRFRCRACF